MRTSEPPLTTAWPRWWAGPASSCWRATTARSSNHSAIARSTSSMAGSWRSEICADSVSPRAPSVDGAVLRSGRLERLRRLLAHGDLSGGQNGLLGLFIELRQVEFRKPPTRQRQGLFRTGWRAVEFEAIELGLEAQDGRRGRLVLVTPSAQQFLEVHKGILMRLGVGRRRAGA